MCAHAITLPDLENYLNKIFLLESELKDKSIEIAVLEFELDLERKLLQQYREINHRLGMVIKGTLQSLDHLHVG